MVSLAPECNFSFYVQMLARFYPPVGEDLPRSDKDREKDEKRTIGAILRISFPNPMVVVAEHFFFFFLSFSVSHVLSYVVEHRETSQLAVSYTVSDELRQSASSCTRRINKRSYTREKV